MLFASLCYLHLFFKDDQFYDQLCVMSNFRDDSKNTLTTHISQGTIMVYYGVNKTLGFFFGEIEIHQP
jgi:hypothetical protein